MCIPQWIIDLASIISNISIVIAAIVAVISLGQWRAELKGKTRYELARRIILLAQKYRDELINARNRFIFPGEFKGRVKQENETTNETNIFDEQWARLQRLQHLQETLSNLHEAGWEAEIILKSEHAEIIHRLEESYTDLNNAIRMYFNYQLDKTRNPEIQLNLPIGIMDRWQEIIYGTGEDNFSIAIGLIVEDIKANLKKYIA